MLRLIGVALIPSLDPLRKEAALLSQVPKVADQICDTWSSPVWHGFGRPVR